MQRVRVLDAISEIDAAEWNACAGPDDPFTSHAYLHALEESGCVSEDTGFRAQHLVIEDASGRALAVMPTYLKSHSDAEIGADMGWAMAYERFRGRAYYPKLQVEVPFTPTAGSRLLVRPGQSKGRLVKELIEALLAQGEACNLASVNINYLTEEEIGLVDVSGMIVGTGYQFIWENDGYKDFEQFISVLKSGRRHSIRRERKVLRSQGISIDRLVGSQIDSSMMDIFIPFYKNTYRKYHTRIYHNHKFFHLLLKNIPDEILMIVARKGDEIIAGSLSFFGGDRLNLMHWGSKVESKHLHFEVTYYQAIEFAIEREKRFINGGPGGAHKVARGFLPVTTRHCHWFRDPEFASLVAGGLQKRVQAIGAEQQRLRATSPYQVDRIGGPAVGSTAGQSDRKWGGHGHDGG